VTRANAIAWQLSEAERLAAEFALLRQGTERHEISNKTLRGVGGAGVGQIVEGASLAPAGFRQMTMRIP
jgi:hypothetical protein